MKRVFVDSFAQESCDDFPVGADGYVHYAHLALSDGGANGAFGAGFLNGVLLKSDLDTRIPAGHAALFNSSSYTRRFQHGFVGVTISSHRRGSRPGRR